MAPDGGAVYPQPRLHFLTSNRASRGIRARIDLNRQFVRSGLERKEANYTSQEFLASEADQ